MSKVVYRGDTRNPEEIIKARGFQAWQELTAAEAWKVLCKFCGDESKLELRSVRAKNLIEGYQKEETKYVKERKDENDKLVPGTGVRVSTGRKFPLTQTDLSRLIKAQKTRSAFWVSTDPTEDCGGYRSGFVYRIEYENLIHKNVDQATMGIPVKKTGTLTSLWLDDEKHHIALQSFGNSGPEISFLTSIPLKCIKEVQPVGTNKVPSWFEVSRKGWWKMPHGPRVPSRRGRKVPTL